MSRSGTWWPSLAVVMLIASSCAGEPAASSEPAGASPGRPSAAASPTPSASPDPAPSNDPLPEPGTVADIVQVVADGLQLRSAAGTGAPVIGGLERGAVARIESDPVEADGFTWYKVVDLDDNRGWLAAGDDEDPWLVTLTDQPDGALVLRYEVFGHVGPPASMPPVTVMDDRRVIMGGFEGGWGLWHLTDAGFERLSDAVLESPYLQASAEYNPVLQPGLTEGAPHGQGVYRFTLGTTAEPIVVRSVQWFGEAEESTYYEPSPERLALDGLAQDLNTLGEALGQDAWVADPLPYVGDGFMVWLGRGEGAAPPGTLHVDASAVGGATSLGDPASLPPEGTCADVGVADAFELARVLRGSESRLELDAYTFTTFATDAGWFSLSLSPKAPDGFPGCADLGA